MQIHTAHNNNNIYLRIRSNKKIIYIFWWKVIFSFLSSCIFASVSAVWLLSQRLPRTTPDSSAVADIGDMSQGKRKRANEPWSTLIVTSSRWWPGHFRRLWNEGNCQDDLYAYAKTDKRAFPPRSCHHRHRANVTELDGRPKSLLNSSGKKLSMRNLYHYIYNIYHLHWIKYILYGSK